MKKIKYLLLSFIVMLFVSIINVDAAGVSIKDIKLVDSKGNVSEVSEPKINGLNINFDLSFSNKDDSVTYEVVLNNPTNKEYEINTEKKFGPSNYISYSYELKDKTNRVKANSEVILNIIIKYENEVPSDKLTDGKYVENNDLGISLLNESNPNTFNNILWIVFILFMIIIVSLMIKYTKKHDLFIIVLALLLVPITVFALEKLKLTVSTKITIEEKYGVYYLYTDFVKSSEVDTKDNLISCSNRKYNIEQQNGTYEEYKECGFVEKDSKTYKPGERVNVSKSSLIDFDDYYCNYDSDTGIYTCPPMELDNTDNLRFEYMCGSEEYYNTLDEYINYYNSIQSEGYGSAISTNNYMFEVQAVYIPRLLNVCTEEELNSMNFNSVTDDYWGTNYGYVEFKAVNQFSMPKHDVYIYKYLFIIN